jgi:hypothetical protein
MKPLDYGKLGLGMYMDASCVSSYEGEDEEKVKERALSANEYVSYIYKNMEVWEKAMDLFRVCQPCNVYNLPNVTNAYAPKKWHWWQRQLEEGEYVDIDDTDPFYCYDPAGYQNVKQVSLLRAASIVIEEQTNLGTHLHSILNQLFFIAVLQMFVSDKYDEGFI